MRRTHRPRTLLGLLALVAGCASAEDRMNDGIRLQAQGYWFEAAYHYIDALDKDENLVEARERLIEVSDSAVEYTLRAAEDLDGRGEPVLAAERFQELDALVAAAREVGVRVATPADYGELRGAAFDRAVEGLFAHAADLRERGRFADARRALIRARNDFQPSAEQRERSIEAEVDLLLVWSNAELSSGRFRAAFRLAEDAVALRSPPDDDVLSRARGIQEEALELGTALVAVPPVTSTAQVLEALGPEPEIQLADDLELDFWRLPPPFVGVVDPVLVRREVRMIQRAGRPLTSYEVSDVIRRVGADFGALIEISSVSVREAEVRVRAREAVTRDGRTTSYEVEDGLLVIEAEVQVVVVDARGRQLTSRTVRTTESGSFERGVYGGDWRELDLSRNELRYFDPDVQAEQLAAVAREVVVELTPEVADRVFDAVLSQVP